MLGVGGSNLQVLKNPPRASHKGHPKDKVDRKKSIMLQAKEKAMKKKKWTPKRKPKVPSCSYCHEEGHSVQTCKYMASAEQILKELKQTEL